jgi:hypothetical protein
MHQNSTEFGQAFQPIKLFRLRCARDDKPLADMDAGNVSMVILDQLSNVIRKNTKNGCLLTREILSFSVTDISDKVVNQYLRDAKDREFWNRLLSHWCTLKQFGSIDSAQIGSLFAASLIGQDGYGVEKAAQFVDKIISSKVMLDNDNTDLNMKSEKSDKFYDNVNINQLKDTQVYQTFVSKSSKTNTLRSQLIDSDEDDDIDKLVVPKAAMQLPNHPIVSPRSVADHFSPAITPRTRTHIYIIRLQLIFHSNKIFVLQARQISDREMEQSIKSTVNSILKSSSSAARDKRPSKRKIDEFKFDR